MHSRFALPGRGERPRRPGRGAQELDDCLPEAVDAEGWLALLRGPESGAIQVIARDPTGPSPFSAEAVATLVAREVEFAADVTLPDRPSMRHTLVREVEPATFPPLALPTEP